MSTEKWNPESETTTDATVDALVLEDSTEEELEAEIVERSVSDTKEDDIVVSDDKVEEKPSITSIDNGVIGVGSTESKPKPKKYESKNSSEKVALFSERNVFWEGVGRIGKGYNITDAKDAEKWLTRKFVRLATPEEIKQEFGK